MILPAELLALGSAASFALSHVVSKRGLQTTSITAGFVIVVTCAWVVVMTQVVGQPQVQLPLSTIAIFSVSGIFAPAISRAAALAGVNALGPSIAVPIQQGLRPLIVLPAAALLLAEGFGPLRVIGAITIVIGGWVLSRQPVDPGRQSEPSMPRSKTRDGVTKHAAPRVADRATARRRLRPGVIFPVIAAIAYSSSDMLVKSGLNTGLAPAVGAAISTGSGLAVWYLAHVFPSVRKRFRVGRHSGWLVASGALMGIAILLLFTALERGDVSLVAPVVATQPLFVFVFSALILRQIEHLDRSTLIAGVIVVAGMILVSL